MAVGLVNPLDSYARNQIKLFRASKSEDVVFLVGKAHNFTTGGVCNFQSGKEESEWATADYPVCMNTDP